MREAHFGTLQAFDSILEQKLEPFSWEDFFRKISFFSSSDLAKTPNSDICICVCLYFCICVFLVFPCVFVFVFEAYLCIFSIFRLHLLLTLLLSSPASIYRQTLAQCRSLFIINSHPLQMYLLAGVSQFAPRISAAAENHVVWMTSENSHLCWWWRQYL